MNREQCGSGRRAGEARGSMGAIFVALVLVLGAGSAGGVLYRVFGFDRMEAAVASIAVLAVLGLFHALIARARDRAEIGDRIADLSRGAADLARQVAEAGRRLAAVVPGVAEVQDRGGTIVALPPLDREQVRHRGAGVERTVMVDVMRTKHFGLKP